MKFIKSLIVCSLVFMSFGMPKMASALEWPDAPEPATNADAMWAMVQQTPEEHGFGWISSWACGPKSIWGKSGTTGGQNLAGGGRLGVRYIMMSSTCGVSQACSTCFDTSTYRFTVSNGYFYENGVLVAPTTTTTTTTTIPPTTTTTSLAPASSGKKSNSAKTTSNSAPGSNPVSTQPKSVSTTTAVDAVEDDGQSDDDFADIGVSLRSGKFDMRISSSFPETEMMLRAFKKGSKSILWNMTTNANGNYRILTTRALKGFTLSLWIDGDKWDSLVVR